MITTEEASIMGINAPWSHQRIISKLLGILSYRYYVEKSILLEPLPETMLDEDQTSPVPDILFYDHQSETVPVIIEITRTRTVNNDLEKVRKLIEENRYGIIEGFVYDYKKNEWHKYRKTKGIITRNASFCNALKIDLAALL
jgi:DNA-dependent RNA polymerase auxiliary subunit epsilon